MVSMNAATTSEQRALSLVEIIDFKWLMAGDGHRVHVEHLQADREYAGACLALAAGSRIQALRETAARLAGALGITLPVR
jgi:hypothetical protein